jgi:type IV pilus assembly protein PilW
MKRARGVTLVELLVASAVMLLTFAGALSLLAGTRAAWKTGETQAELQEAARAALDLLAADLRLAGHLGLAPPGTAVAGAQPLDTAEPVALAVGGRCGPSLAHDLEHPLGAGDGRYGASATTLLGCAAGPAGRVVGGADTLVVRHAGGGAVAADAGRLQLESTRRAARLFADGERRLGPSSRVSAVQASVYYVSADSTGAAGQPSLRRKRLVGGTRPAFEDEELLAGVADLQLEFGLAAEDAAAGAERYVSPADLPAGAAVRSVRLWLLLRSDRPEAREIVQPALAYANRSWPAERSRLRRLVASRSVTLRNGEVRP